MRTKETLKSKKTKIVRKDKKTNLKPDYKGMAIKFVDAYVTDLRVLAKN